MNLRLAAGLAAVALCFPLAPIGAQAGPPMIPAEAAPEGLVGKAAPAFSLARLDGGTVSLADLKGKVVLVNFWASWCGPCRSEMPELEKLSQELAAKGVVVLGVNVDREREKAERWLQGSPVSFPIALDADAKVMGQFGVNSMPTSFIVDRKGVVRHRQEGYKPEYIENMRKIIGTL